jgi:hypothetical protein
MMFDNYDTYYFNPHHTIYASWHRMLPESELRTIGWQSVPTTASKLWRAWRSGYATWYGYARAEAEALAPLLTPHLSVISKPFDIVCHSLGCYLTLLSLRHQMQPRLRRLIMINAAVYQNDERNLLAPFYSLEGYNVVVPDDGLLAIGARLDLRRPRDIIGIGGAHFFATRPAMNVVLRIRARGRRLSLDLSNPNRLFNHLYSFEAPEAAALLRALVTAPSVIRSREELPDSVRDAVAEIYPFAR